MAEFELKNAVNVFDQICRELEHVGECSIDPARKERKLGEDGFNNTVPIDPQNPHQVKAAAAYILAATQGRPIVFSSLVRPDCTLASNLKSKAKKVIGRIVQSEDFYTTERIWRIDFLFKAA